MNRLLATTLIASLGAATAASAGDFSLGGGVTATSDYIYLGVTQTNHQPALQGYLEGAYKGLYAGVWTSTVKLTPDTAEIDPYVGYRGAAGKLTYDVNYTAYGYNNTKHCCDEYYLSLGYPVTGALTLSGKAVYEVSTKSMRPSLTAEYAVNDKITVSGTFGHSKPMNADFGDIGVSYALTDAVTLDARYYDNSINSGTLVAAISYDFSILGN